MTPARRHILIAGGGIAGLSVALALEQFGFAATVFERSAVSEVSGAGIQISPNASRLLDRLGVLPDLLASAVEPKSVLLCNGATTLPLLSLDITDARKRWGAPYLVAHRADLHAGLLKQAKSRPAIRIRTSCEVSHFASHANGVTVSLTSDNVVSEDEGMLLIGADGVWSRIRARLNGPRPEFTGQVAFRKMLEPNALPAALARLLSERQVAAFLSPNAHLVAYPVSGGRSLNLVAITKAQDMSVPGDGKTVLPQALQQFDPSLAALFTTAEGWTPYPIHAVPPSSKWSDRKSVVLLGDAAHAMEPYAAQGAAMAIEDAWVFAASLAKNRTEIGLAIREYEALRRPRIKRVAQRTRLNRIAYHASGPLAAGRNMLFQYRAQSFKPGLDWLYAWDFKTS
jgi:salicylate hydroxylase